jgi:RNA polymerase sigma-70 factor (ECF subfamily)
MVERVESLALLHDAPAVPAEAAALEPAYLSPAEQALLARARSGDERALREIYMSYEGQVRGHLYRLLGADSDVDDLVQTVFARAFSALSGFQGNATIGTWLYRITANTTHNLLRQRYRRERVKAAFSWFHNGRHADTRRGPAEARNEAERLLQQLRPDLREVFVLYHYEGLTLQEIGHVLSRPISTVGDKLTRARASLRDLAAG